MWKLLTGITGESVCSHLEEEQLLPPDQKGGRKGCKGTKNQLMIDNMAINNTSCDVLPSGIILDKPSF